jgi:hypothetical protein
MAGVEPATFGFEDHCSGPLSYMRVVPSAGFAPTFQPSQGRVLSNWTMTA